MKDHFVLLPGTLCDERIFQHLTPEINSYEVIDLRHSETIDEMVEKVSRVSHETFVLIGFSMGGHVSMEFTLKYPDRVKSLIVMAASGEGYPPHEKQLVIDTLPLIEKGKFSGITDKRLKDYLAPKSYENQSLKDIIHQMAGADAKEVYLRQTRATLNRRNLIEPLKAVDRPVLFIAGSEDKIVSKESILRTSKSVKGSKYIAIKDCGHFIPLESPELMKEIVKRFLED